MCFTIDLLFPVTDLQGKSVSLLDIIPVTIGFLLVSVCTTRIELRLTKEDCNLHWKTIGTLLPGNDQMVANSDRGKFVYSLLILS